MGNKIFAVTVGFTLLLLGLWGQYELSPSNITNELSTSLYQVLMLFFFGGEWTLELPKVPIQIEIVRFLAPLATITSIILAFASATRISILNFSIRYYRHHLIVVGLDDKVWQFLRSCPSNEAIVVVDKNPNNLLISKVRQLGIKVVVGDIFEDDLMQQLNLAHASELVAFMNNDGKNVELAIKARNHMANITFRGRHLKIHIHLKEISLAHRLENYPKFFADHSIIEMSFFSVYDLSARLLIRDYPPEIFADVAGHKRVHLAIYGYGRLAEKLIIEAALTCQYANASKIHFTIFDSHADAREEKLESDHPYLQQICSYKFIQLSNVGPYSFNKLEENFLPSVTQHIVCKNSDEESLNIALMLRSTILDNVASNAPIMVRMQESNGLAQLLESNTGDPEIPDGLYPFGMLDQVLDADIVLSKKTDELARSIHIKYLKSQSEDNAITHIALQDWNDLPEWERKQNLLQADHWPIKLRAVRCRPTLKPIIAPTLTDNESEIQATMEHNRYVNTKFYDGWKYGKERLEAAKINPFLTAWKTLSDEQRHLEIDETRTQAKYFADHASTYTQRTLVIGVTGHRLHKLDITDKQLHKKIEKELTRVKLKYVDHHFIILSPLAEGADRLVAKIAMRILNATLQVPLPLPYDLYVHDFSDEKSIAEFKQLVGLAEYYYEMPMKFGNIRELAILGKNYSNEARDKQYALVGAYIATRSDELIALWDGLPENGIGGTAQVIRWFNGETIDAELSFKHQYFTAPKPTKATIISI